MEMVSESTSKPLESLSPKRVVDKGSDAAKTEEYVASASLKMEKTLVSGASDVERVVSRTSLSSAELEEHDKEAVDAIQNIKRSEVDSVQTKRQT